MEFFLWYIKKYYDFDLNAIQIYSYTKHCETNLIDYNSIGFEIAIEPNPKYTFIYS